jgi:Calcineurin-like phosphoesterase/Bacterial Ig domain
MPSSAGPTDVQARPARPAAVVLPVVVAMLAAVVAALVGVAPASAAPTCQTSQATSGFYAVEVCLTAPADGATVSGSVTVSATLKTTATGGAVSGAQRMVFSLDEQYLLTDYQAPYSFTLDTRRFVDGIHNLRVHALMRDTYVSTPEPLTELTFANGVTTPPVNTRTFTASAGAPVGAGDAYTVVAAGDGAGGETSETAVTNLIASMKPHQLLYLGDVYEKGSATEFDNYYGPQTAGSTLYGRFKSITLPTIGNHEYTAGQAPGYFDYWDNPPHYYSVNRHGWHIISLDSNSAFGQLAPESTQYKWLQDDLATNTQPCTLAFYHHPLHNVGDEGSSPALGDIWNLLASKGVDLVLNGHDHTYQRYLPMDGTGKVSTAGTTEFVVGAGGHATGAFPGTDPNLAFKAATFGALKLELGAAGATYSYVSTAGQVLDSGSTKCNPSATDTTAPTAPSGLTATGVYKTRIDLAWPASHRPSPS